jgi:hypothetical protein
MQALDQFKKGHRPQQQFRRCTGLLATSESYYYYYYYYYY